MNSGRYNSVWTDNNRVCWNRNKENQWHRYDHDTDGLVAASRMEALLLEQLVDWQSWHGQMNDDVWNDEGY